MKAILILVMLISFSAYGYGDMDDDFLYKRKVRQEMEDQRFELDQMKRELEELKDE